MALFHSTRRWFGVAAVFSLITLTPLAVILSAFLDPSPDIWAHLSEFVLPRLLWNTFILMLGVSVGGLVLAVPLAWLIAMYDFPGRRFFSWALMLPLAMPAYVMAFTQIGLFDFTGPIQTWMREVWGTSTAMPPIRSTG
ncbi:MAG: ABC transporter permease, partial [Aquaspirillum sp.]